MPKSKTCTTTQAAELLSVGQSQIYHLIRYNHIDAHKCAETKQWIVDRKSVERYEKHRHAASNVDSRYVTALQYANIKGISIQRDYYLMRNGFLPGIKIDGANMIRLDAIDTKQRKPHPAAHKMSKRYF